MTQPISEADKNWKDQAQFWQLKYLELQQHTNQVITQLLRDSVAEFVQAQLMAQLGAMPTAQPAPTQAPSVFLAKEQPDAPGPM